MKSFRWFLIIIFILALLGTSTSPAFAASLTVTKIADTNDGICNSDCSLREAISAASTGDTITFDSALSGQTITLSSTLVIDKDVTIDGSGLNPRITISGNNTVGVMATESINGVTLNSLSIKNGNHLWGGGINNLGVLTLLNCIISNNNSDYNGGGIANFGELALVNTTISGNTAATDGGGIYNDYYVGSVSSQSGKLTVTDSIIADNTADYGGGIFTRANGEVVTVINSNFSGNSAVFANGGGIYTFGTLIVLDSTFTNNSAHSDGGGIYNSYESTLTVTRSTFLENTSLGGGGGIYNDATSILNVTNSTFSKNSANNGGGIFNFHNASYAGILSVTNSTFSENSAVYAGGSIYNFGTLNLTNSILANSVTGNDCYHSDFNGGTIGVNNNNLIETNAPAPYNCGAPAYTADPNLGPLADNGGPTQTMELLSGSPAIDAGDDASCPATDQRVVPRPQGSHCDIGAYEKTPIFEDVPLSYWSNSYIERLYNAGITGGCSAIPLNYCPTTPVTRAQAAIFLLRGIHGSAYTPPPATGTVFTDVPLGTFGAAWIEQLAAEGITSGCGGGNYCPNTPVARAQMAIFLVRAKHGSTFVPPTATGIFPDVPVGSFGADFIEQLAADAITNGCGGGNYCPNTMVKRDSMAVFLVKTFNLP